MRQWTHVGLTVYRGTMRGAPDCYWMCWLVLLHCFGISNLVQRRLIRSNMKPTNRKLHFEAAVSYRGPWPLWFIVQI
jgi:hypothetical protein